MGKVDPKSVMALHQQMAMPVMDCKAALLEADGDLARAIEVLRLRCRPVNGGHIAASPGFWEQFSDVSPNESPDAEPGAAMQIATFKARCGSCLSEFCAPFFGDFDYGCFLFSSVTGNAFAHFHAINHPIWKFAEATLSDDYPLQNAIARIADPVGGQRLVCHHVCPVCQSSKWARWEGDRVGSIRVEEATFNEFQSLSNTERTRALLAVVES
jgi:hypothetical protein